MIEMYKLEPQLVSHPISLSNSFSYIKWRNRLFTFSNNHNGFSVTVDGRDLRIYETTDFNTKWFSRKFHGPGICYEVAISMNGGQIVHIQGPYPAGKWPDIKIFRECFRGRKLRPITGIMGSLTRSARPPCIILAGRKTK
jgi:hypothetical protein